MPVSSTLTEEYIGFEEIVNGIHVFFCGLLAEGFVENILKIMLSGDKMIVEYSFGKARAFLGVRFVCSYRTGQGEMSATIPC